MPEELLIDAAQLKVSTSCFDSDVAYSEGQIACISGQPSSNPYCPDDPQHAAWLQGWQDQEASLMIAIANDAIAAHALGRGPDDAPYPDGSLQKYIWQSCWYSREQYLQNKAATTAS